MTDEFKEVPILNEGKDGWTTWVLPAPAPGDFFRKACCDCGLTHKYEFRVEEGKIEFRVSKDDKYTSELRKSRPKDFPLAPDQGRA